MPADLLQLVQTTKLSAEQVAQRTSRIHALMLSKSKYLDGPNFTVIHPHDLDSLFGAYDRIFFEGQIKRALGRTPLEFGLSRRMTSAGGTTAYYRSPDPARRRFKISVATSILYQCFADDDHRPIVCGGITCRDRLDALQRIMEHELVHLIENLLWDTSSCAKPQFHGIALRHFGHTDPKHKMITPREKAFVKYGVRPGAKVRFRVDGVEHCGVVNRVTKRATVLVADSRGAKYADGKRYAKYYVPVQMLKVVE